MAFEQWVTLSAPEEMTDNWADECEKMNTSKSEYIRLMVNAGRNELGYTGHEDQDAAASADDYIQDVIVEQLLEIDGPENDELVEAVKEELEEKVRKNIAQLNDDGEVDYDYGEGGLIYVG